MVDAISPSRAELCDALHRTKLFDQLSDEAVARVTELVHERRLAEGESLFEVGTQADSVYVIGAGEIALIRDDEEKARFVAGDSIGEVEFAEGAIHTTGAVAAAESVVWELPEPGVDLSRLIERSPVAAADLLGALVAFVAGRIRTVNNLVSHNAQWVEHLRNQVFRDKLTGLLNPEYLEDTLKKWVGARRPFAIIMVKPDNFKDINDTYGHEAGDTALQVLAKHVLSCIPEGAEVVRYLGNQNAVLVPDPAPPEVDALANSLRDQMVAADLSPVHEPFEVVLTFCSGAAFYPPHGESGEEVVKAAHEALFDARALGRGRTVVRHIDGGDRPREEAADVSPSDTAPTDVVTPPRTSSDAGQAGSPEPAEPSSDTGQAGPPEPGERRTPKGEV